MTGQEPDVEAPRYVWWSPTAGLVLRHPDDSELYVAVSGRDGEYLDEWPTDGKLLRAEHNDWRGRAVMWERMAHKFAVDADARVAKAEAAEAQALADVARLRAQIAQMRADRAEVDS